VPTLAESLAAGGSRPIHDALATSLDVLSADQTVTFVPYLRTVLPVDGYIFWLNATLLSPQQLAQNGLQTAEAVTVSGSLHYSSRGVQARDETIVVRRVDFATPTPIAAFAEIAPNVLYVATWTTALGPFKFTFSSRGTYYQEASLSHYEGDAVYPAFEAQLIESVSDFDQRQVVSNSLPLWLSMAASPSIFQVVQSGIQFYPSDLVPDNLVPAYGVVDVRFTRPLQAIAWRDANSSRWQLCADRVLVTMYGLRNDDVMNFLDYSVDYCAQVGSFGLMNTPFVVDEHRTQVELAALAQKKTIEYEVSYYQKSARTLARQMIRYVSPINVIPLDFPGPPKPPLPPYAPIPPTPPAPAPPQPLLQQLPFYLSFSLPGTFAELVQSEDGLYELFDLLLPAPVTFPPNLASSPTPGCETAPEKQVVLTLLQVRSGSTIGVATITFAAGSTSARFSSLTINGQFGDRLRLTAPANVSDVISGIYGTIVGLRTL
jgi:hypothetical protein